MPKTTTTDGVVPAAAVGPVSVLDPANHANRIQLDPGSQVISASGGARPIRMFRRDGRRNYNNGSNGYIGSHLMSRYIAANDTGGWYGAPFHIPIDMDVTESVSVYILIAPQTDAFTNGQVVRFDLARTRATPDGSHSDADFEFDWNVPDDWKTTEPKRILMDNGSGYSFAGSAFAMGDVLGLRVARFGAHVNDTFDRAVHLALFLQFEYTASSY